MKLAIVAVIGVARIAAADAPPSEIDPCRDSILDPVSTPVRDAAIDAQRGACLRNQLGASLLAGALIDTPGFRGVLGGALRVDGRMRIGSSVELTLGVRFFRYLFVQNAVNKVTNVDTGPVTVGGAWAGRLGDGARIALAGTLEVPATRYEQDTTHVGGELTAVVSAALTERTVLHARLGAVAATASSAGGRTNRLALRAGADLVRPFGRRLTVAGGADMQAGWYGGLDHINVRLALQLRLSGPWRGQVGFGIPVGGAERTNLIVHLGVLRDLR